MTRYFQKMIKEKILSCFPAGFTNGADSYRLLEGSESTVDFNFMGRNAVFNAVLWILVVWRTFFVIIGSEIETLTHSALNPSCVDKTQLFSRSRGLSLFSITSAFNSGKENPFFAILTSVLNSGNTRISRDIPNLLNTLCSCYRAGHSPLHCPSFN